MLLLKTNPDLKVIFNSLVNTMNVSVTWNEIFIIMNNTLILSGNPRSLIFNFENKRVYSDILDFSLENQDVRQMPSDPLITNLFNMILYAFGKWGAIKKIKVEKDYAELNYLFQRILKEVRIEPSFRDDNFRFYREGMLVTYEDAVDAALNAADEVKLEMEEEDELGLWHSVKWKVKRFSFERLMEDESNVSRPRIGNNFYSVNYVCPSCKERIFMTLFPEGEDVLIETEEGRVYLARAYACNHCNTFYTPKPKRILGEGEDAYCLEFDDDRTAYEDYLEQMGKQGTRDASSRLNEYASERNRKEETQDSPEEVPTVDSPAAEEVSEEALEAENVYEPKHTENITENSRNNGDENGGEGDKIENKNSVQIKKEETKGHNLYDFSVKTIDELKAAITQIEQGYADSSEKKSNRRGTNEIYNPENLEEVRSQLKKKLKVKYDARFKIKDRMSKRELMSLKKQIQKEIELSQEDRKSYIEKIDGILYEKEEREIRKRVETALNKPYAELVRIIHEIEQGEGLEEVRKESVKKLKNIQKERGKREVEQLVRDMPSNMEHRQQEVYLKKIKQYGDVDIKPYEKQLKHRQETTEKEEIERLVRHKGNRNRKELVDLYEQLEKQGYKSQNVKPYLKKVHEKIVKKDEEEIAKICPDVRGISFEEGMEAYRKISEGVFLPEIKERTLEMIRRRLLKIKTDENLQLIRKLQKEMKDKIQDFSRLYFYEARKFQVQKDGEQEENAKETLIMYGALSKYALNRNEFEFPLLIGDSSIKENGKKGFVLTPEHIFYRSFSDSGRIHIMNIEDVEFEEKKFKRGIYVNLRTGTREKLPNLPKQGEKKILAEIINDFIKYLQEKPESRNIDYLVKEEHVIKCCYRCGHTYDGGNICPKCGSKINH